MRLMIVSEALTNGAQDCDAMITSGGVSVGDADYISETIEKLGTLAFWRLNLKPGKPMAFGKIENCWIFGLPGNPVSHHRHRPFIGAPSACYPCRHSI